MIRESFTQSVSHLYGEWLDSVGLHVYQSTSVCQGESACNPCIYCE